MWAKMHPTILKCALSFAGCDIHKASQCRVDVFRNAKFTNRSQFCAKYVKIYAIKDTLCHF